jgi:hypothetical protein
MDLWGPTDWQLVLGSGHNPGGTLRSRRYMLINSCSRGTKGITMNTNGSATEEELKLLGRLSHENYESPATTDEIYDLGKFLLSEQVDRAHQLDSKAAATAGFCGAIVALLLSTTGNWEPQLKSIHYPLRVSVLIGVVALMAAAALAFIALVNRTFYWIDERGEWFDNEYLNDPDQLKRFHVFAMYKATRSHEGVNGEKAMWLSLAQLCFILGAVAVAIPLLAILWVTLGT